MTQRTTVHHVELLPAAALDPSDQRRAIGHIWRLALGVGRFGRPRFPDEETLTAEPAA